MEELSSIKCDPIPTPQEPVVPVVLIADTSIMVRELYTMFLERSGYQVETARDGIEALGKLNDGLHCDVIFCDPEMPRMSGYELLRSLKQDPRFKSIPVVILSSRGIDRRRNPPLWQTFGAVARFQKPLTEEALLEIADQILRGRCSLNFQP